MRVVVDNNDELLPASGCCQKAAVKRLLAMRAKLKSYGFAIGYTWFEYTLIAV